MWRKPLPTYSIFGLLVDFLNSNVRASAIRVITARGFPFVMIRPGSSNACKIFPSLAALYGTVCIMAFLTR